MDLGLSGKKSNLESTAKEIAAPHGITLNALLPAATETERLRELGADPSELAKDIPAGRLGKPEELGKLAAFLCSQHAGFITGQAICFDGGNSQGL